MKGKMNDFMINWHKSVLQQPYPTDTVGVH
jgi:hypothetical protein